LPESNTGETRGVVDSRLDGDTDNLGLIPSLPSSCQKENLSRRNQKMSKIEKTKQENEK